MALPLLPLPGVNRKTRDMIDRTAAFADSVLTLAKKISDADAPRKMRGQLIDAATSVAANYRAACRARTRAEFIAKIGIVREEADESQCWLEMLLRNGYVTKEDAAPLIREAGEITAIANASFRTAKGRNRKPDSDPPNSSIPE
jgi:four helix bundle protein